MNENSVNLEPVDGSNRPLSHYYVMCNHLYVNVNTCYRDYMASYV